MPKEQRRTKYENVTRKMKRYVQKQIIKEYSAGLLFSIGQKHVTKDQVTFFCKQTLEQGILLLVHNIFKRIMFSAIRAVYLFLKINAICSTPCAGMRHLTCEKIAQLKDQSTNVSNGWSQGSYIIPNINVLETPIPKLVCHYFNFFFCLPECSACSCTFFCILQNRKQI